MSAHPSYDYRVEVVRVVDGDTLDLRVDLGFYTSMTMRFRLLGVDTPERREQGWSDASLFTAGWLEARKGLLRARTAKADSFGRWLADVYATPTGIDGVVSEAGVDVRQHLSDDLIRTGHGKAML